MIKSYFVEKEIGFHDRSLKSGIAKRHFNIEGDSVVAFIGDYHATLSSQNPASFSFPEPCYFESALHVIVEHKRIPLLDTQTRNHLLLCLTESLLGDEFERDGAILQYQKKQLNLSRFIHNTRAGVFHVAFFIYAEQPKYPIIGLDNFDVSPKNFAMALMQKYCKEMNMICT